MVEMNSQTVELISQIIAFGCAVFCLVVAVDTFFNREP